MFQVFFNFVDVSETTLDLTRSDGLATSREIRHETTKFDFTLYVLLTGDRRHRTVELQQRLCLTPAPSRGWPNSIQDSIDALA